MRYTKATLRVLLLYFIAVSVPSLFGVEARTSLYSVYQAAIFCLLFLYTTYSLIRYRQPAFSRSIRFAISYIGLLTIVGSAAIISTISRDGSIFDIAQILLPILVTATLLLGFGGAQVSGDDVRKFLTYIMLFLVFSSVYNIVVNFHEIISIANITNSYQVNIKGFYSNRNVFGYMMAAGTGIAIYLWTQKKKILYLFFGLIMALSMILAMSRGGILFAILCVGLYLLFKYKAKMIIPMTIASITATVIISQPFVQNNIIRADNGDTGRSQLRNYGIDHFMHNNIITGEGQNAIDYIVDKAGYDSFHNLYVETLATQGIVGIVALFLALVFSHRLIRKVRHKDYDFSLFLLAFLYSYIIYVMIEALPLFYATPNSVLTTYLLIVLPLFLTNNSQLQPSKDSGDENTV